MVNVVEGLSGSIDDFPDSINDFECSIDDLCIDSRTASPVNL